MKTFHLEILTPYKKYLEAEASYLFVSSSKYPLGVLPGHADLVSTVDICKAKITINGEEFVYATSGGIIKISKDSVILLLDSIESLDEIDIERAKAAKERAENRLAKVGTDPSIDMERTKKALARAINRLRLIESAK